MGVRPVAMRVRAPRDAVTVHGHFELVIRNADGSVADRRQVDNVMCVDGLTLLAYAINWSALAVQNAQLGSPFSELLFGPIWGAVGTGTTPPTDADVALSTEVARVEVSSAGVLPAAPGSPAGIT